MLHITQSGVLASTKDKTIYVSQNFPAVYHRDVIEIFADGDELEALQHKFPDLPKMIGARTMKYPQPWAGFIAANMVGHQL